MFFIVTTGRSGSTTIARTLAAVPELVCLHEPEPALIRESAAFRQGQMTEEEIAKILRETRHPVTAEGKIYCESNQTLSLLIPVLHREFPQARFIWLVRNGLDVVASAFQKQWYSGHSENHPRYEDSPPVEQAWIDGRIRGDHAGEMDEAEWDFLSRFEKCCWYWSYVNRLIAADFAAIPRDAWMRVRLEDLPDALPELFKWMELPVPVLPAVELHNPARRLPYHWSSWSTDELTAFEKWCGPLMDQFYFGWRAITGAEHRIFIGPALAALHQRVETLEKRVAEQQEEIKDRDAKLAQLHAQLAQRPQRKGLLQRLLRR